MSDLDEAIQRLSALATGSIPSDVLFEVQRSLACLRLHKNDLKHPTDWRGVVIDALLSEPPRLAEAEEEIHAAMRIDGYSGSIESVLNDGKYARPTSVSISSPNGKAKLKPMSSISDTVTIGLQVDVDYQHLIAAPDTAGALRREFMLLARFAINEWLRLSAAPQEKNTNG